MTDEKSKYKIPLLNLLVGFNLKCMYLKKNKVKLFGLIKCTSPIKFTSPIKIYKEGLYEHDTERIYVFKFILKCIRYLIIAIIGLFIFVLLIDFFANVDLETNPNDRNNHIHIESIFNN